MNRLSARGRLPHGTFILVFFFCTHVTIAQSSYVATHPQANYFPLSVSGKSASLYVAENDYPGIQIAAKNLQTDIKAVTNNESLLLSTSSPLENEVIIIGTLGKNTLIDQLIQNGKLDASNITGKWESFVIQTIELPFPNVKKALIIAGSDKRGTIFGIYDLSKAIGVSPWYWWADVPVEKKSALYIVPGRYTQGEPAVKYRGIFLNDEEPALGRWAVEKYGGFNHQFYEKVFGLLLRLKGNYLWPAMWWASFNSDDPLNPKLADDYGIVMGTTHHEPMMRAHAEWRTSDGGAWNYETNASQLQPFWTQGIQRMNGYESIVSVGMRGDGDMAMTEETNIALLQRIVTDQRKIIGDATGKNVTQTPQLWALYKEVQDYYDKGMTAPDDVTLLLCDDNWGNLRKLPNLNDKPRSGGYGVYYHFDYVGGPRNYKWINTNPLPRIWEQMNLAHEYGANQIWIVNVGDLKPMELPISFFLDYAWNPSAIQADQVQAYTEQWCIQQFGVPHAREIASLLSSYAKFNGRVKPELLNEKTYSLTHYNEFERVVKEYDELAAQATSLSKKIGSSQQEAYYQLVLHPITASANLYELYYYVALNKQAVANNDIQANHYADKAKECYLKDSLITIDYHQRNNGKWNHMMSQTHIGYTDWQQPEFNKMPEVTYLTAGIKLKPVMAPASQNARHLIPGNQTENVFYEKDNYVSIEAHHTSKVFNTKEISWHVLPDHGRTGSAITPTPVTANAQTRSPSSPHVEYEFYTYSNGEAMLQLFFSPTLNVHHTVTGLQYAISIDDEQPRVVSLNADDTELKTWENWVAHNVIVKISSHKIINTGKHIVKFWMIDPGPVLQKLVLDLGGLKPSYLGPPETIIKK